MKNKKQTVFIISESSDGCFYYRSEVFSRYSKSFKVRSNVDFLKNNVLPVYDCLEEIFSSDVVIFLRPTRADDYLLLVLLKSLGKAVGFSGDDSFKTIDKKNPAYNIKKDLHINEALLRNSDFAITTTESLRDEYEQVNNKVILVPNLIDTSDFKSLDGKPSKTIRVGLIGSVHTAENAEKFMGILKKIHSENPQVVLVFFGSDDFKMVNELKSTFINRVEFVRNVPITEYSKKLASLRLDIALIPRKDNQFNRSKSNCKYLEVSALNIATIAQGFTDGESPYQKDIINGETGYIAIADDDWVRYFDLLMDSVLRKMITEKAYSLTLAKFDAKKNIELWDGALLDILDEVKGTQKHFDIDLLSTSLTSIYKDKHRDLIIKNLRGEVKYLNGEIDRIRNRPYYKALSKTSDIIRMVKKN